jgi:hypothetical protein
MNVLFMKGNYLLPCGVLFTSFLASQTIPKEYFDRCRKADSLYHIEDYKNSALMYSAAMKANGWKGYTGHRYSAARCWALANIPDSAIFYLNRALVGGYNDYRTITLDPDLKSLHADERWAEIIEKVKLNKDKAEVNLNKILAHKLDSILEEDQSGRLQTDEIEQKYGRDSKEMNALWRSIGYKDSLNEIAVMEILDKYGWLGPEAVGQNGNSALFLVIQHADLNVQEKYLPMMREAVKNGKARGSSLALLEDRVALRQGKDQMYGSQIGIDPETEKYYVLPLMDPDNVNKRRAEVGLPPIQEYINHWNIKWDVEQYKKDLPELRKLNKH